MSSVWVDLLGAEVRFANAGGVRTRYIEAGSGPALIFLHGVGGHAEGFSRNVLPLSEHFRVLAVDYLGFGLTDKPTTPVGRDEYVRHLTEFMDAVGVDRAHIVGESLGGWLAMWMGILRPERVGKIISICGARMEIETDAASKRHLEEGVAELHRLTRQFVDSPSRENVKKRLEWLFYNTEEHLTEELVDIRWQIYMHGEMQRSLRESGDRLAPGAAGENNPLGPDELRSLDQEVLLLWTSHNPSTPAPTAKRALEYLPHGKLKIIDQAGHWPQWESPEEFNDAVIEFLQ